MKRNLPIACATLLLLTVATSNAAEPADPFRPYLDGKAPEIIRGMPSSRPIPENITLRRVVFRSRDDSEIFAAIAAPKTPGKHPGMLVLHGGGGSAEVDKAMAWGSGIRGRGAGLARHRPAEETNGFQREMEFAEVWRGPLGGDARCERECHLRCGAQRDEVALSAPFAARC